MNKLNFTGLVLWLAFVLIGFCAFTQCPVGEVPIEITIVQDDYPGESSWYLFANDVEIATGTTNSETVCADADDCMRFEMHDSYGDGMCCGYGLGSYAVSWDGVPVASGGEFSFVSAHSFNCPQGSVCDNPFSVVLGNYVAPQPDTYYAFTPDSTGIYAVSTCDQTNCNTRLWVYDNCSDVVTNSTEALYFNDDNDQCGEQSYIEALLSVGVTYTIRVGLSEGSSCNEEIPFSVSYVGPMSSVIPIIKLTTTNEQINNDVKVPVLMQIIDNGPGQINLANQTDYAYEGDILAEWQGFTGPFYPKKNFDFDLIDALGNKIDASLLGLPAENDWLFKAEYLDNSLLINTISYEFARRMGRYAPRTKQCEILLDGNYIGVYTLTEKVKRDSNRVDIANLTTDDIAGSALTGGYIIEMNINGSPGAWNSAFPPINSETCGLPVEFKYVDPKFDILPVQEDYIKNYVDSFENSLYADTYTDPALGYRNWIDVSTFIDFLIVNEFSMNYDSYGRSTYMYKEKDTDGGLLCIGPPWDYDRAMASDPNSGWVWENTHPGWPFPFWWSKMYSDEVYRHELACRWLSLREDVFSTANFMNFIDSAAGPLYMGPAERNFNLWQTLDPNAYGDQINNVKTFLENRLLWMDNTLAPFGAEIPSLTIPSDTVVCMGSTYSAPFNSEYFYNWIPGPETSDISFQSTGSYVLEISDEFGCYSELDMNVVVNNPDASFGVSNTANTGTYVFTGNSDTNMSYVWDFDDNSIGQEGVEVTHEFQSSGDYTVTLSVTDSIGCQAESSVIINTIISGLHDQGLWNTITVYPNPASHQITIHNGDLGLMAGYTFIIQNTIGQTVFTSPINSQTTSIDISTLKGDGMYYLQVFDPEKNLIANRKIIIE